MSRFIYRYISFESFVGMIQSQALTFVLPEVWDDPHENKPFIQFLESKENIYERMLFVACFYKTYGQCWTQLAESDAMWRIYSYNNRAIRIKVTEEKIQQLINVHMLPVNYTDAPFKPKNKEFDYLASISQKRIAFEHEKEIRLINYYRFSSDEDFEKHIKALMVANHHPQQSAIIDSLFPNLSLEKQVEKICELLNIGINKQRVKDISFEHIPEFIGGVMVHPQAPQWYVAVVQEFCKRNNIPFDGKSMLYV